MQNINLSIIIPHYNSVFSLDKLLKSIVVECKDDTQIIVVDDTSTEGAAEYENLKRKYENRVEFYTNCSENGAGTCRNIGIDKAKGRWLLFCDSDDYMISGWHSKVLPFFSCEHDVVFFMPVAEKIGGGKSERADWVRKLLLDYENDKIGADIRLRCKHVSPWSKLIKREVVMANNIRFDSTMYANDVMFSIKLGLQMKSFQVSRQEIYCVTEGSVSLTKNKSSEAFMVRTDVAAQRVRYIVDRISYRDRILAGIGVGPATRVYNALKKGGVPLALECIKRFRLYGVHIVVADIFVCPLVRIGMIYGGSFLAICRANRH